MKLSECLDLSPSDMAWRSPAVQSAIYYSVQQCNSITLPSLRSSLLRLLENPAPTFFSLYPTSDSRSAMLERLQAADFVDQSLTESMLFPPCNNPQFSPQPFWCAPGSDYERHHSHPGGLALHTALNIRLSLAATDAYKHAYGHKLNHDLLVSAQLLHDCMKPWVLQWQADGSSLPQARIANAGSHHVFGLAESIYRGMPSDVVIAQCCTHSAPSDERKEEEVVRWLQAGALLAGQDAIEYGLIGLDGKLPRPLRQEWYLSYLGDRDCILSVPSAQLLIKELKELACLRYSLTPFELDGVMFHTFRNWIFSQCTISHLHQIYIDRGRRVLFAKVNEIIEPD